MAATLDVLPTRHVWEGADVTFEFTGTAEITQAASAPSPGNALLRLKLKPLTEGLGDAASGPAETFVDRTVVEPLVIPQGDETTYSYRIKVVLSGISFTEDAWFDGIERIKVTLTDPRGLLLPADAPLKTVLRIADRSVTSGDDDLDGSPGHDRGRLGSGDDRLNAAAGNDVARGGAGNDWIAGEAGHDTLLGGLGADSLLGGAGDDVLQGGRGNDLLQGGAGSNILHGGGKADRLVAGTGDNTLTGGAGADTFQFADTFGTAVVTDFSTRGRREVLDLTDVDGLTALEGFLSAATEVNGALVYDSLGDGQNVIVLEGIAAADLKANDFLF